MPKKIKVVHTRRLREVTLAGQRVLLSGFDPVPVTAGTRPMLDELNRYMPFGMRTWLQGPRVVHQLGGVGFRWDHPDGLLVLVGLQHDATGERWLHVSYSHPQGVPSHRVSAGIRESFFRPGSVVVQIWPPEGEYVNDHENVLHLWERVTSHRLIPDLRAQSPVGMTV